MEDDIPPVVVDAPLVEQFLPGVRIGEDIFTRKHIPCARGTIYDKVEHDIFPQRCKLLSCPYCRRIRVNRICLQIAVENVTHWRRIEPAGWTAYKRQHQRKSVGYVRIPLSDALIVISELGEKFLPDWRIEDGGWRLQDLGDLLEHWVERASGRISTSRGFGGESLAGCRNESRGRYRRSGKDIDVVVVETKARARAEIERLESQLEHLQLKERGAYHVPSDIERFLLEAM